MRAALVASCLRGAFPPVDLRAVCFVRAMICRAIRARGRKNAGERRWGYVLGGPAASAFAKKLAGVGQQLGRSSTAAGQQELTFKRFVA